MLVFVSLDKHKVGSPLARLLTLSGCVNQQVRVCTGVAQQFW